jgi:23S rRNA pseudouridine1911/1915/1917 synthase
MSDINSNFLIEVPSHSAGSRLDKALAELMPEHTRSAVQGWIKRGLVTVDGAVPKQKHRLSGGEKIQVTIPAAEPDVSRPQNIPLDIIYEDRHLLVLNKQAGLVVHPGAGNQDGTLLNALLYHDPALAVLPRAGIVHRLDKDTTGLMVVARTEMARQHLIDQLDRRTMRRQYQAIINGVMISGETIDQPIGRHRQDRLKMTVTSAGKKAITHIRVLEKFRIQCRVQARLETGRTHQIRVHLGWKGHPIVGDRLYGCRTRLPKSADSELVQCLQGFGRQALHAQKLSLTHPESGKTMEWETPVPADMESLGRLLDDDALSARPR